MDSKTIYHTQALYDDLRVPYFYIIKHIPTNKIYAGCRYGRGCQPDELLVTYFTSSNKIKRLINDYGYNSFIILRIDTNCDGLHPFDYETLFLESIDASNSDEWLNSHNNVMRHENFTNDDWKRHTSRKNGLRQGKINSENGHMKRIQKLSNVSEAGRNGALVNKVKNKGSFYNKDEHKKAATLGGKVQGKKNADSGHLKSIANDYWNKVRNGEITRIKKIYIHDPCAFKNKMIPDGDPIPEGWVKGRAPTKNRPSQQ